MKIIRIVIQIEGLHRTKFLDPDQDLDPNPDNFGLRKHGLKPGLGHPVIQ